MALLLAMVVGGAWFLGGRSTGGKRVGPTSPMDEAPASGRRAANARAQSTLGELSESAPKQAEEFPAVQAPPEPSFAVQQVDEVLVLTLQIGSLTQQIEAANSELLSMSEGVWDAYWSAGQYEVVTTMGAGFLTDAHGRPRPMQIRVVDGESRVVVLPPDSHPKIWTALESLAGLRAEKAALEQALASELKAR